MAAADPTLIMADFVRPGDYEIALSDRLCNRLHGKRIGPRSFLLDGCWIECLKNDIRDETLKNGEDGWLYYPTQIALTDVGGTEQGKRISSLVLAELQDWSIRAELIDED